MPSTHRKRATLIDQMFPTNKRALSFLKSYAEKIVLESGEAEAF